MAKRGEWVHKLAALAALATLHGVAAGTSAAAAQTLLPVPPTTIGINLSTPAYFRQSRSFANLALGSSWISKVPGYEHLGPDVLDKDGNLKTLPGGQGVMRALNQPSSGKDDVTIRCTYDGQGDIKPTMAVQGVSSQKNGFTFHWRNTGYKTSAILLRVTSVDAKDPIRNFDCREADMPRNLRFTPEFLALVRQFKVIRFMDWQNANGNEPITWADRHTPTSLNILDHDGVSVEDMVDLSAQAGADPWFNMPWNADDDYVRHFAQYVHDHLPRDRKVYVEAGNEVWNARFPMSKQAFKEGQEEGLSPDPEVGRLYRYAEKLSHVMDIWAEVFADRPSQLVRVANCQNGPSRSKIVLGYKDTAKHIDALATAPYFGFDFRKHPPADLADAFVRLDGGIDTVLNAAILAKGIAAKYGKRYIAYEAGQHIMLDDLALAQQIQSDPRMYYTYKKYLDIWRASIGDTIMMYESVQPVVKSGSWGLLEYIGQPLDKAPKMRAVVDALHQTAH